MRDTKVWYLCQSDTTEIFSGYGLGKDSQYVVGILMVDRPKPAPQGYLESIMDTFGECLLFPMALDGSRGVLCQMTIVRQHREYVKDLGLVIDEYIREWFSPLIDNKPKPHFLMQYSNRHRLWVSEFYKRGGENQE